MVKHVTHKIQNAIQMELFGATKSIKIAMSWFTNELLFQPLLLKLQAGVEIEIILNDDDINHSDEALDFEKFIELGGVLRWNTSDQLMHDKFCIIDDRVVISGSYNWTNKAEYNDELVSIFKDETETSHFFNKKFVQLANKYPARTNSVKGNNNKKIEPTIQHDTSSLYDYETASGLMEAAVVKDEDRKNSRSNNRIEYSQDGKRLLKYHSNSVYVEIEEGVLVICNNAFEGCNEIEYINIPNSVRCIGKEAFRGCRKLKSINLPKSTKILGELAFMSCYDLYAVVMPSVEIIGSRCFGYTKALHEITIPASIKAIYGNPVVDSCVKKINSESAMYCVQNGVLYGDNYTRVLSCSQEKVNIQLPQSVTRIEEYAFNRCRQIESIQFPQSLEYIGNYAFGECKSLKKVIMNDSLRSIEDSVFSSCESLEEISFSYSLRRIGSYAFNACSKLKNVTFPSSLRQIGNGTFNFCKSLENVRLPNSLTWMGSEVFSTCYKLKEIRLPNSLDCDLGSTFRGSFIEKIIIPKGSKPKFEILVMCKNCHPMFAKTYVEKLVEDNY